MEYEVLGNYITYSYLDELYVMDESIFLDASASLDGICWNYVCITIEMWRRIMARFFFDFRVSSRV